ncbi:MAG: GtrA family protein [Firmicutes bacterium]|nr:GtrA family protein [Bacillota bacterium]
MGRPVNRNLRQAVQFVLFSCMAGVIQTLCYTLLSKVFHWEYWPAYLTALILSVLYNFTVNRRFTFRSAANVPAAMAKVFGYYCVFTPLSTWWGDALTAAGWNDFVVLFGTMVINLVTEFLFCRFVVYRNSIDTNEVARKKREQNNG